MNEYIYFDGKELTAWCKECGHAVVIPCTEQQHRDLMNRTKVIQQIFPDVPAGDREVFLSGWCSVCFDGQIGFFRQASDRLNKMADEFIRKEIPEAAWDYMMFSIPEEYQVTVQDLYDLYCDFSNAADEDDEDARPVYEAAKKMRSALFDFIGMIENEELEEGGGE